MNILEIRNFLSRYTYFDESKKLLEFFTGLPDDLDLDSAKYYISKGYKSESSGYDEKSFTPDYQYDPADSWDNSGYDANDDEDYWWVDVSEDEEDEHWCDYCQQYVADDSHL